MPSDGTHGESPHYACPEGMTDIVTDLSECGDLVMCSGSNAGHGQHAGHG